MKKIILLSILITTFLFAVGEAGAIFLTISPSPTMNGLGGSGTSVPTADIYSSYFNPAQPLLPNGLSFQSSDMKTDWLPNIASDLTLEYDIKMIGYNGFSLLDRYLLQFSISRSYTYLNLGEQIGMDEFGNPTSNWNSYMSAEAITYSLGIKSNNFPIYLGIGRTNKKATQVLSDMVGGTSKDEFYDWGFRVSIDNYTPPDFKDLGLSYSLGYSKANIGDFISFVDVSQADPAPTTARLGMTFGGEVTFYNNLGIDIRFIREADEMMIETIIDSSLTNGYERKYKDGLLGDIDIGKHIIDGRADKDVTIHKGMEINFFNFYSIRKGKLIDLEGKIEIETEGYGINYGELIIFLSYFFENRSLREMKILQHLNIKYNYSKDIGERGHPRGNISYDEITVSIKNIDNFFW